MFKYADLDFDSGVDAYQPFENGIMVQFKNGSQYEYTTFSAGKYHIDMMKKLARNGDGLNAYINRHVRMGYSRKIR